MSEKGGNLNVSWRDKDLKVGYMFGIPCGLRGILIDFWIN